MATKTIETELLDLEKQYWQAIKNKDVDTAARLTDDPCIITGAQGVRLVDRQALTALMKATPFTLHRFEIKEDAEVRVLRDDVAIVAYNIHEELTADGKPVTLDAADSSVWVRREGHWVCALHTESMAGDSFGRDRQPAK